MFKKRWRRRQERHALQAPQEADKLPPIYPDTGGGPL
jgi:hypothetical protein